MTDLVERLKRVTDGYRRDGYDKWHTMAILIDANAEISTLASRISQQDAELERVRRELEEARAINANLMGDDESVPRYTTKRLHHEIDKVRKAAFIEAAEITNSAATAARNLDLPTSGAVAGALFNVAHALLVKSEDTGR